MTTYVYWVHYPHHTNPKTEGYIGVSKNPSKRLKYHSSEKYSDNSRLLRSINKGAVQSILFECSSDKYAYILEENLRPSDGIGWNIQSGGLSPPSQQGKKNPKVSHSNKTRVVSDATRNKMSCVRKKLKWYTNGVQNTTSPTCPEGYRPGKTCPKGWWRSKNQSPL